MPIGEGRRALTKKLPVIYIIDISGSMYGARIAAVNEAMDKVVPALKEFAANEPSIEFSTRVITYGDNRAEWRIGDRNSGVPMADFDWLPISDSEVDGGTPAEKAIELLTTISGDDYKEYLGGYLGTPMVILISDGEANDQNAFKSAVDAFRASRVGNKFVQVAIGIATEKNARATDELKYFGQNGFRHATDNPDKIVELIVTATMKSVKTATEKSIKTKREEEKKSEDIFEDDIF